MSAFSYIEKILSKDTFGIRIKEDNQLISYSRVITLWQESKAFCTFYNQILREVPFYSFFWENKPISQQNMEQTYEFVVKKTTAFNGKRPNKKAFQEHFKADCESNCSNCHIVRFDNLGKDAKLIVPCPIDESDCYTHLATFIRNAPSEQINCFWKAIGESLENQIGQKPVWLSTSGLGVCWLHARVDSRPKYYTYSPYKSINSQ